MKRILKNKLGITLLEGVIALGLLALAAGASFGVLLSVSRKSSRPDLNEEMLWAVERAHERLQTFVGQEDTIGINSGIPQGLCGGDSTPLSTTGSHDISCMLPAICDRSCGANGKNCRSSFSYTVGTRGNGVLNNIVNNVSLSANLEQSPLTTADVTGPQITFSITCNGFTL